MAWRPSRVLIVLLPAFLCLSLGRPASAGSIDISVMTQNLYTGADTDPIIMADSIPALQNAIAVATQSVIANNFPARAAAIAAEAAKAGGPLLIGLQEAAHLIRQRMKNSRVGLLFGSEKRGLSNDDMSYCHWLLQIPTREEHRSMNLGQAVAVCLYELSKNEIGKPKVENESPNTADEKHFAEMETVERVTRAWLEALQRSGYVGARARSTSEEKLRRLLRRFTWEEADAEVVLGMMKKIAAKLNKE